MAVFACPDCQGPVSDAAAACPRCGRPFRAVQVQTTQGATGKFLDPGANLRSCLGCVALFFVVGIAVIVIATMAKMAR